MTIRPDILAPAGDAQALLAAVAAGADAVYVGLKHFSARMQAENFSITDLARLAELARGKGVKLNVAMNTLLGPGDPAAAGRLVDRLARFVRPDALIVQDPGMPSLIRQTGYKGEVHLSTLANVSHQAGLRLAADMGASRVILPRELSIDEIKAMEAACPQGVDLEVFVHGALCYCVSGRCWWSSYMGGKSGLRGRCVQPCRRVYNHGRRKGTYFPCQDLSLDVLVKTLLDVPRVRAWKIEGRKKGPHYVFYAVSAYRMLRDNPDDPAAKKEAQAILDRALGRAGSHFFFLPQRRHVPVGPDRDTASGLLAARIAKTPKQECSISPRFELLPGDLLRVGTEDEAWHRTEKVRRRVPKGGSLTIQFPPRKSPPSGAPVYLIDRREQDLADLLRGLENELGRTKAPGSGPSEFEPSLPRPLKKRPRPLDMTLRGSLAPGKPEAKAAIGLWLSPKAARAVSKTMAPRVWWWLPPVIWPDEEGTWRGLLARLVRGGSRRFVCNAPWQAGLFEGLKKLELMAGPFCNIANPMAIQALAGLGFSSAVASPELDRDGFLALAQASPLPLGMVIQGFFPVGLSRIEPAETRLQDTFASPKGEVFWLRRYGQNTWVYPNWPLDLTAHRPELEQAGYAWFIRMQETPPHSAPRQNRTSTFNWDLSLL